MRVHKLFTLIITAGLTIYLSLVVIASATDVERSTLTLDKAIEIATANNTLIKQAIENQEAAIEEQKSARADFLPKASTAYSYTRLKDSPYMKTDGAQIDIADNDQYHWDLTLSQPLFTGFALSTRYEMAKLGVDVKDAEKEQAVLDVVKQVKVAYFNILLTKKFLLVADEAVNQLESHLRDAEKFYKQGMIPYNDLLRSKVALADALQNRVRAEGNVEMAVSAFNTLLRIDLNKKTDVEDIIDITPYSFELTNCIKEAIEKRPELKALRLALKNADHVVTLAQSAYYPEVALVGSYEQKRYRRQYQTRSKERLFRSQSSGTEYPNSKRISCPGKGELAHYKLAVPTADDNIYRGPGCQDIFDAGGNKLLRRALWVYDRVS
jgi:outer membrane protein TolC